MGDEEPIDMNELVLQLPIWQEVLRQGREEGMKRAFAQGRKEGELQALRDVIISMIVECFPRQLPLAQQRLPHYNDPVLLEGMVFKLYDVLCQQAEDVRKILLAEEEEMLRQKVEDMQKILFVQKENKISASE